MLTKEIDLKEVWAVGLIADTPSLHATRGEMLYVQSERIGYCEERALSRKLQYFPWKNMVEVGVLKNGGFWRTTPLHFRIAG